MDPTENFITDADVTPEVRARTLAFHQHCRALGFPPPGVRHHVGTNALVLCWPGILADNFDDKTYDGLAIYVDPTDRVEVSYTNGGYELIETGAFAPAASQVIRFARQNMFTTGAKPANG